MEQPYLESPDNEQPQSHALCPVWQVWAVRIALVIVAAGLILTYINIARGGR